MYNTGTFNSILKIKKDYEFVDQLILSQSTLKENNESGNFHSIAVYVSQ